MRLYKLIAGLAGLTVSVQAGRARGSQEGYTGVITCSPNICYRPDHAESDFTRADLNSKQANLLSGAGSISNI